MQFASLPLLHSFFFSVISGTEFIFAMKYLAGITLLHSERCINAKPKWLSMHSLCNIPWFVCSLSREEQCENAIAWRSCRLSEEMTNGNMHKIMSPKNIFVPSIGRSIFIVSLLLFVHFADDFWICQGGFFFRTERPSLIGTLLARVVAIQIRRWSAFRRCALHN